MQNNIKLVDVATWKQADVTARAGLGIIKSTSGEPEFVAADEVAELTGKAAGESDRVVRMVMSRGDRDRDGDRINPKGWDLEHYNTNPVALFAHDYKDLPIGKSLKTWVGDSKGGPVLRAMIQFATADMNPRAEMVYKLLKAGYLNAGSVGFLPRDYAPDEKQEGEDSSTRVGFRIDSAQLLENSIVPVGSHPGALAEARDAKIDLAPMVEWIERILDDSKGMGLWLPRKDIENAWAIVRPQQQSFIAHAETIVAPLKDVEARVKEATEKAVAEKRAKRSKAPRPAEKLMAGSVTNAQDCLAALEQCAQFLFGSPTLSSEDLIRLDASIDVVDGALDILLEEAGVEDEDDSDMMGGKTADHVRNNPAAEDAPKPQSVQKDSEQNIIVLADSDRRAATHEPGRIRISDPEHLRDALRARLGTAAPTR